MRETLYDRAKRNYNAAKLLFERRKEDPYFINLTGYLLHKTVEFGLKYVLSHYKVDYPDTRDIALLIRLIPADARFYTVDIAAFANTITTWDSKSIYTLNYFFDEDAIQRGFRMVYNFFWEIEAGVEPPESEGPKGVTELIL